MFHVLKGCLKPSSTPSVAEMIQIKPILLIPSRSALLEAVSPFLWPSSRGQCLTTQSPLIPALTESHLHWKPTKWLAAVWARVRIHVGTVLTVSRDSLILSSTKSSQTDVQQKPWTSSTSNNALSVVGLSLKIQRDRIWHGPPLLLFLFNKQKRNTECG